MTKKRAYTALAETVVNPNPEGWPPGWDYPGPPWPPGWPQEPSSIIASDDWSGTELNTGRWSINSGIAVIGDGYLKSTNVDLELANTENEISDFIASVKFNSTENVVTTSSGQYLGAGYFYIYSENGADLYRTDLSVFYISSPPNAVGFCNMSIDKWNGSTYVQQEQNSINPSSFGVHTIKMTKTTGVVGVYDTTTVLSSAIDIGTVTRANLVLLTLKPDAPTFWIDEWAYTLSNGTDIEIST